MGCGSRAVATVANGAMFGYENVRNYSGGLGVVGSNPAAPINKFNVGFPAKKAGVVIGNM